jgi:hypothetical protein
MHKLKYITISIILAILLSLAGLSFAVSAQPLAAPSPTLGAVKSYSVLSGSIVTNTGNTTMPGDLGVYPGSAFTGFPPGQVILPGVIHAGDSDASLAQVADTAAFGKLNQKCTKDWSGTGKKDLTTVSSLGPGVYCADAFLLTKNLTLLGTGIWIFKSVATLTKSSGSSITGGDPCNLWWREVSSATIGTKTGS